MNGWRDLIALIVVALVIIFLIWLVFNVVIPADS